MPDDLMRVANLIVTYTNPKLTERLINRLGHEHFDYYIHVDKKIDIEAYRYLARMPNVFLVKKRIDVRWAGYNTVKAIFSCINEVLESGRVYNYFNLLSGQDYPLKPPAYIIDFLTRNEGKQFIEYEDIETDWLEAMIRLKKYDFANFGIPFKHTLQKLVNFVLPERKLPMGLKPYGKGMFWILTPSRAKYVYDQVNQNKQLARFFKYTWGGDEIIFQTLLLNSPYRDECVNDDCRYIDWSAGGGHPKVLALEDFEQLKTSSDLFGRKFLPNGEGEIFDRLDQL